MNIPRRADAIFALALLIVCPLTAFVGLATPIGSYAHDTFFFLDNAYRVAQGQIPQRDYSSAWGPVMFLIDAAGLKLSGMRPAGIGYANAISGALIATWSFSVVRPRSDRYACIIGIYTLLLVVGPFPLGNHPRDFCTAMTYNRYGYALFGIVLLECAVAVLSNPDGSRPRWIGPVSTGVALGILAFLKISYVLLAIPFAAFSLIGVASGRMRRATYIGAGLLGMSLIILWYMDFALRGMLQDLRMAASARRLSLQFSSLLHVQSALQAAPLLFLAVLVFTSKANDPDNHRFRLYGSLLLLLTVAIGGLLLVTNQQSSAFPLNGYVVVGLTVVAQARPDITTRLTRFGAISLVTLCCLPLAFNSASSLAYAAVAHQWRPPAEVTRLSSVYGDEILFAPVRGLLKTATGGEEYVAALNDGLDLLHRRSSSDGGVLVFDQFNPFNYLLGRPSPTGGFAAAAYDYIFSEAVHPTADQFFGNAPYVMVRKYPPEAEDRPADGSDVFGLLRLYGSALAVRFSVVEETEHWVLWRRR